MSLVRQVESKTKLRVPNYQSVAVYQLTEAGWRWGLGNGMSCMLYSLCANNRSICFRSSYIDKLKKTKFLFEKLPDFIHLFIIFNLDTKVGASIYYHFNKYCIRYIENS
jgi:hypothetical protein